MPKWLFNITVQKTLSRIPVNCKINLITMRMANHASASGYDRLVEFLDTGVIHPVSQWTFAKRLFGRTFKFLINRSGSVWYHRDSFINELFAASQWVRKSGQIFHFLYGENSHRYLGVLKSMGRRNFIVCTYHTPPEMFCQVVHNRQQIRRLDAIIVVSTVQSDFFSELVGPERVFYIPHGIDVEYFKPMADYNKHTDVVRALFVGSMLRDFETLAETAHLLNSWVKDFRVSIVTSPKHHHFFQGIDNIELYSGISDEKLLHLYQTSDIFLLPLLDCTANNSMLEAMACGLPIVSTDLPGVRDYVNNACALLAPKCNPKALAEHILYLKENEVVRQKMALESRKHSLDFRWQKVASKTTKVYQRICT